MALRTWPSQLTPQRRLRPATVSRSRVLALLTMARPSPMQQPASCGPRCTSPPATSQRSRKMHSRTLHPRVLSFKEVLLTTTPGPCQRDPAQPRRPTQVHPQRPGRVLIAPGRQPSRRCSLTDFSRQRPEQHARSMLQRRFPAPSLRCRTEPGRNSRRPLQATARSCPQPSPERPSPELPNLPWFGTPPPRPELPRPTLARKHRAGEVPSPLRPRQLHRPQPRPHLRQRPCRLPRPYSSQSQQRRRRHRQPPRRWPNNWPARSSHSPRRPWESMSLPSMWCPIRWVRSRSGPTCQPTGCALN